MSRRHLYVLAATLAALGLGLFLYKALILGFPLSPSAAREVWELEIKVRFTAIGGPVKLSLHIPGTDGPLDLTDEMFFSGPYGLTKKTVDGNHTAVWSTRNASGRQTLYYRATLEPLSVANPSIEAEITKPPAIEEADFDEAAHAAAEALLKLARDRSADTETLVAQILHFVAAPEQFTDASLMVRSDDCDEHRLDVAAKVLGLAGFPARVAHGLEIIAQPSHAASRAWLEVFDEGSWSSYELETGQRLSPDRFLKLWHGLTPLAELQGGIRLSTSVSLIPSQQSAIEAFTARRKDDVHWLAEYSTLSLPLATQAVYRIILTIPLGVLVLVLIRNVIGFTTFGTFMPVLIALAFRETELLAGIILFAVIVGVGLAVRFYLDQLKLLLVPRLASLLIIVILLMGVIALLSYKLGFAKGLSVSLFPMVILTMTIERMTIVWEERGASEALEQGVGSLAAAALAYLVMRNEWLDHLVFVFPELLLLVLAATLLLGRYTGYRLLELRRFRVLARGGGER